jgi:uncharacterized membrane protein YeaQ/YmgE (transglycosylase-associated protein family)
MSILAWVALGLIVGFVANKIMNRAGEGVGMDIALGVVGAVLGGGLFNQFGSGSVTGLNPWALLVAVTGAVVVLMGYHTIVVPGLPRT